MGAQAGGIASPPMRSDTSIEAAPTVLVVDAAAAVRRLLRRVLCGRGFDVIEAANGAAALAAVSEQPVDVVLLDSVLPDRAGLDVLDTLRSDPATATLPVILLTGHDHPAERVQGLEAGASDYLVKPVDLNELVARVRAQLRGRDLWRSQVADALHQRAALAGAIASISESCGLEEMGRRIVELLLGLESVRSAALVQIGPVGASRVLAGTELDRHGFAVGSTLPYDDVQLMLDLVASDDRRLFPRTAVVPVAQAQLRYPSMAGDVVVAALGPDDAPWALILLETDPASGNGTDALRQTGAAAADLIPVVERVVGPVLARQVDDRLTDELNAVIAERAFTPHYQPIVDLTTGEPVGYEALTRFADGTRPDVRFAQAAQAGLGIALERATLEAALLEARRLPAGAYVSVNVSPAVVTGGHVDDLLPLADDRPIVLEVTEHERVQDYEALRARMRSFGPNVRLSVDDAGSGWASLRHVFSLRPDYVKVDRGWVSEIHLDEARQALLLGVTQFVQLTGGCVVAEGIETEAELETLRHLGIPMGQGFLLGVPARAGEHGLAPIELAPLPAGRSPAGRPRARGPHPLAGADG